MMNSVRHWGKLDVNTLWVKYMHVSCDIDVSPEVSCRML